MIIFYINLEKSSEEKIRHSQAPREWRRKKNSVEILATHAHAHTYASTRGLCRLVIAFTLFMGKYHVILLHIWLRAKSEKSNFLDLYLSSWIIIIIWDVFKCISLLVYKGVGIFGFLLVGVGDGGKNVLWRGASALGLDFIKQNYDESN